MSAKRRIRCFLFDLGSTLWTRQEEGARQANENAYRLVGTTLHCARGGEIFASQDTLALGYLIHKAIEQQISVEKRQRPNYEPDFAQAAMNALRLAGLNSADRVLGASIFESLRVRIPVSRLLFPDALQTLKALKQRGYTLGVVTNRNYGGQPFREDLQVMGLLDYFEYQHMAISADLGIRKPHPDIFKYALDRLNVVPEEAAMVGDNLQADIGGAQKLNMLGIWKPKPTVHQKTLHTKQDQIIPDLTIEHLHDLLEVF